MDCVPGQCQKKTSHNVRFQQIFFLVCAIGWLFFSFSAFEYQDRNWFPILLGGRLLLLISALFLCSGKFLRQSHLRNIEFSFLFICLIFQAICGSLEGLNSIEFTNFMSVFILVIPIFHNTTQRKWAIQIFPFMCAIIAIPFFFKSWEFFDNIGIFIDKFSAVVAATVVSFLMGRATSMKNEALAKASELQLELTKERDIQRHIIEQQAQEIANASVTARIAQATQMMAHDVRRPFSMLRTGIDLIRSGKTADQILARSQSLILDVEDSLDSVDSLISDIIAISNQEELKRSAIKIEDILQEVIQNTIRHHQSSNVEFDFCLHHTKHIHADGNKMRRVILNILVNAFQAMGNAGLVTIKTNNKILLGKDAVEIKIFNSGPLIDTNDINNIFDSFFTSGKKGGTGLGLSIAKTFVTAHGGEIYCDSTSETGVCFSFAIHATGDTYVSKVPILTKQIPMAEKARPLELINDLNVGAEDLPDFHILIVEDERIFVDGIICEIENYSPTGYRISTSTAYDTKSAHKLMSEKSPDLILLDIDLGPMSPDGLQFLEEIRSQGSNAFVCIHSNRTFFGAGATPQSLGADYASPKPMQKNNLSNILELAHAGKSSAEKPKIIVVDDEHCYLTAWKERMVDAEVITFDDPEIFWDEIIEKIGDLNKFSCMIFDFFFQGSDMDRLKIVRSLRSSGYNGPIILSSNAPYDNALNSEKDRFDLVINKRALTFSDLKKIPEIKNALHRANKGNKNDSKFNRYKTQLLQK